MATLFAQPTINFPASLTERYRPHSLEDFIGLEKPKKLAAALIARPYASAWRFVGPSGTGKTTLAMAIAELIPAELHHIQSQECNLETLERVCRTCQYVPMAGKSMHLILVDEADQMTAAAQLYLLSKLDGTAPLPNTIWIFTCNETDRLQDRFLSRTLPVEFSTYGLAKDAAELLARIWQAEAPSAVEQPNFARLVKDSSNNVRESLMKLETELLLA